MHVTKFKGSQGSWEAEVTYSDGSREILACVHKQETRRRFLQADWLYRRLPHQRFRRR
jgi:hypothetical protein